MACEMNRRVNAVIDPVENLLTILHTDPANLEGSIKQLHKTLCENREKSREMIDNYLADQQKNS